MTERRRARAGLKPASPHSSVGTGVPPELLGPIEGHDVWFHQASARRWFADHGFAAPVDESAEGDPANWRRAAVLAWARANGLGVSGDSPQLNVRALYDKGIDPHPRRLRHRMRD